MHASDGLRQGSSISEGRQTIGPRSSAKMLKTCIIFSLKFISLVYDFGPLLNVIEDPWFKIGNDVKILCYD